MFIWSHAQYYAQRISEGAHYLVYGYELNATSENLQWALKQRKEDILKYTFKDSFQTYSIMEYAVKCEDYPATCALVQLGANLDFSSIAFGSMLHFYMKCLREDVKPNLDILHLLINKIDINTEDGGFFQTPLEIALETMAHFKKVHWDVVEILLQRRARIIGNSIHESSTPFQILENSWENRRRHGYMIRSFEEEQTFLSNLSHYSELQRKYHPQTECYLSFEAFQYHTSNFQTLVTNAAVSLSSRSFIAKSIDSFAEDLQKPGVLEGKDGEVLPTKEQLIELEALTNNTLSEQISQECEEISRAISIYYKYFQILVKEIKFKQFFTPWQLTSILPVLKKHPNIWTQKILQLFESEESQANKRQRLE